MKIRFCCSSTDNGKGDDSSDDESLPDVFSSSPGKIKLQDVGGDPYWTSKKNTSILIELPSMN